MPASVAELPLMDVDHLRVGMFVHLDLSWMSHPFPRSRFRISSPDQIDTIRGLGLKQVRWSPEESVPEPAEGAEVPAAAKPAGGLETAADEAGQADPDASDSDRVDAGTAAPVSGAVPVMRRLLPVGSERRVRLADERVSLAACERQFAEAARGCKTVMDLVVRDPLAAAGQAQDLARSVAHQMLGAKDLCIRVLSGNSGDRASAHAVNVAVLSMLMAHAFGWDDADMMDIGVGALLHDVGKLDLNDRVRYQQDDFTASELRLYQQHVAYGVAHGQRMKLSPGALAVIADHHEAVDRSGFPRGLSGDRMSAAARVVALVDRFDGLCNPIQLSRAVTPHEAVSMMFAQHKNKFDITILGAFIKLMGVYPAGSVVQLTDSRYAMVMAVNSALHSSRALKPVVLAFDPKVPREEAVLIDLETRNDLSIYRSVRPQVLPPEVRQYLQPRARMSYGFDRAD